MSKYHVEDSNSIWTCAIMDHLNHKVPEFRSKYLPYSVFGPEKSQVFSDYFVALCPNEDCANRIKKALELLDMIESGPGKCT